MFFVFIFISLLSQSLEVGVDKTLEDGATGCDVVKAAYDKFVVSGIFPTDDNFLLPRVAVASGFGTDVFISGGKGIWQTTDANLQAAKSNMNSNQLADKIKNTLCIDFAAATQDDMSKPLYSMVCAGLLLQGQSIPMRSKVEEQKSLWMKVASVSDQRFEDKFYGAAKDMDQSATSGGSDCFKCFQAPTDLILIADKSGSISTE